MNKIKYLLILFVATIAAAQEKTLRIELSVQNGHDSMKLHYEELSDVVELAHLPCGKHKIYLMADQNCKLTLDRARNKTLHDEDLEKLEKYFASWDVKLYDENTLSPDCLKLRSRTIPVSVYKTK